MNEALILVGTLLVGASLGAFFFGGLWWTVRMGPSSEWSGLVFSGSFIFRTCIVVAGFYLVSRGDWIRLVASMVGFLLARSIVTKLIRIPVDKRTRSLKQANNDHC